MSSLMTPQMREIALPMLKKFKEVVPVIFDDLIF
jgi:thymidylate synthase ThyX